MLRELKDREKQRKQSQNINKEIENLKKKQILELKCTITEKEFSKACLSRLKKKKSTDLKIRQWKLSSMRNKKKNIKEILTEPKGTTI